MTLYGASSGIYQQFGFRPSDLRFNNTQIFVKNWECTLEAGGMLVESVLGPDHAALVSALALGNAPGGITHVRAVALFSRYDAASGSLEVTQLRMGLTAAISIEKGRFDCVDADDAASCEEVFAAAEHSPAGAIFITPVLQYWRDDDLVMSESFTSAGTLVSCYGAAAVSITPASALITLVPRPGGGGGGACGLAEPKATLIRLGSFADRAAFTRDAPDDFLELARGTVQMGAGAGEIEIEISYEQFRSMRVDFAAAYSVQVQFLRTTDENDAN